MLYRDEHGVGRFPMSDRIYMPIVNCHEVKMNSDGFQYDSRQLFQLPSKEKVNWTLGDNQVNSSVVNNMQYNLFTILPLQSLGLFLLISSRISDFKCHSY